MKESILKLEDRMVLYEITNCYSSVLVPELEDGKISYQFFAYYVEIRDGKKKVLDVGPKYKFINEEKAEKIKLNITEKSFLEIDELKTIYNEQKEEYYNLLGEVEELLYKTSFTEEEKQKLKLFKDSFYNIVDAEMQEKVYKLYVPNFINWINNI